MLISIPFLLRGKPSRWPRLAALGGLLVLLGGCSEPPRGSAIRFGLADAPVTLDPRFATDGTSSRINRLLYARLVDFDASLRPVASLATWEVINPIHYRFRLRPERASFADGTALDAADVKATYDAVLAGEPASPHRGGLKGIASIDVLDSSTIDFHLHEPDSLFPGKLVVGILPAERIATHPFNREPIGSGQFELVSWANDAALSLRRRRDGQQVDLLTIKDPNTRVLKLLNREVDLLQGDLSPEMIRWLEQRPGVEVQRAQGTKFAYLGFNLEDPVVGQPAIRSAIGHAIDREAIVRHVMGRSARLAGAILPPSHWAGFTESRGLAFDPERARALLRQAGYGEGEGPEIVYKTSAAPFRIRLATIIQAQLAAVGIRVTVRSNDWGTFYGDVKAGRFQMYSLAWVGIKMPDIFRYVYHSDAIPPNGANRGRYRSEIADRLIEQAEAAPELAEQAKYYRALQAHVLEQLPYVPLWYEDTVQVSVAAVRGYRINADGNYDGLNTVTR